MHTIRDVTAYLSRLALALTVTTVIALAFGAAPAAAGDGWELDVLVTDPQYAWDDTAKAPKSGTIKAKWKALDSSEVSKKWHLCVLFPHVKDPYYLAADYGIVEEGKRLGIKLTILEAGGWGNMEKQISQVEDCAAQDVDAIILFALSAEGLVPIVNQVRKQGIKVHDCGVGTHTEVDGRNVISYYEAGVTIANYLKARHPSGKVRALWLPGPPGVIWVETPTRALYDATKGTNIEIVKTMYGDAGKPQQLALLEDGLQTYGDLDYVIGGAPAIEVAIPHIREIGKADETKLIAFYIAPGVEDGIRKGAVLATVLEPTVMWARLCVAQTVHALEGRTDQPLDASPLLNILDTESIKTWKREDALAPATWTPVFTLD